MRPNKHAVFVFLKYKRMTVRNVRPCATMTIMRVAYCNGWVETQAVASAERRYLSMIAE